MLTQERVESLARKYRENELKDLIIEGEKSMQITQKDLDACVD